MAYSRKLTAMLGEEVGGRGGGGGAWSGSRRALFPFDQIFQNTLYAHNALYGGIRKLCDIFDKPFRNFLPFFEGGCKICQLRMVKPSTNQN